MKESLVLEWDYEKNGNADPTPIADHSNKKYYWICTKGHPSFFMSVAKRTLGHGCPVCSNHKIIKGINDFETTDPELMVEWAWEQNNQDALYPSTFSSGSSRLAWWKCKKCGNVWRASVSNRTRRHSGCPYCANLKVKEGYNDLASIRPELVCEWDYEKNAPLKPEDIVACYAKKVWWRCKVCGNSWSASPNARARRGCPYCCNHVKIQGFNDFESQYPELVKEWDYGKNKKHPSEYAAGSDAQVWWRCTKGHSWKTTINSRTKRENGCPYCSNKKVLGGYNDLFTTNPELREEWDYNKNKDISPNTIGAGSSAKVWWICKECGQSWETMIHLRAIGSGCPTCGRTKSSLSRQRTMASKNPLFEQFPELEVEWDSEKNKATDISILAASSNAYAWWKCREGHSFRTRISSRTLKGVGCPYCHGQKVLTGINDLQTLLPWLAAEWDHEKNAPLTPRQVFSHGSQKVWWKCPECGNSWKAKIHNRANGRGCPVCNVHGTSFPEQVVFYYVKQIYTDAVNRCIFNGVELDIFIPSTMIAVEYDGAYYHSQPSSPERDDRKDIFCAENGIRLLRLREKPLPHTSQAINLSCDCSTWTKLEATCIEIVKILNPNVRIIPSIARDYPQITKYKNGANNDLYYQQSFFD